MCASVPAKWVRSHSWIPRRPSPSQCSNCQQSRSRSRELNRARAKDTAAAGTHLQTLTPRKSTHKTPADNRQDPRHTPIPIGRVHVCVPMAIPNPNPTPNQCSSAAASSQKGCSAAAAAAATAIVPKMGLQLEFAFSQQHTSTRNVWRPDSASQIQLLAPIGALQQIILN